MLIPPFLFSWRYATITTQQLLLRIHEQWMINGLILTHFSIIQPNSPFVQKGRLNSARWQLFWNATTSSSLSLSDHSLLQISELVLDEMNQSNASNFVYFQNMKTIIHGFSDSIIKANIKVYGATLFHYAQTSDF